MKNIVWLFYLITEKVPPATCDSSEVARAQKRRCYLHTENGRPGWCFSGSLTWLTIRYRKQSLKTKQPSTYILIHLKLRIGKN